MVQPAHPATGQSIVGAGRGEPRPCCRTLSPLGTGVSGTKDPVGYGVSSAGLCQLPGEPLC